MTHKEFLTAIESYYNIKYEIEIEIKIIVEFLRSNVPDDQLETFFHKVTDHHSKKWKSLPDKSILIEVYEKHRAGWVELRAEQTWRELLSNDTAHDVLIVDPVAYFVVSGFGSWDRFVNERDGQYRELVHNRYIERYVSAARAGMDVTPKPLAGHYHIEYGHTFIGLKTEIIGDALRGAALLAGKIAPTQIEKLTSFIKAVE